MIEKNIEILPNRLFINDRVKNRLIEICDIELFNKVFGDFIAQGYEAKATDEDAYWDITNYIDKETRCTQDEKAKVAYAFAESLGFVVIDNTPLFGEVNVVATLIRTNRVSEEVGEYLVEYGYNNAHGIKSKIE